MDGKYQLSIRELIQEWFKTWNIEIIEVNVFWDDMELLSIIYKHGRER